MIPGITISMGGQDWQVPPLTLGQLRRLWPKLQNLSLSTEPAALVNGFDTIVEIVLEALSRNYEDMTAERLAELLDMGNLLFVINAVMKGSGLQPGEAEAVTARPNGGFPSMDSTSPPQV